MHWSSLKGNSCQSFVRTCWTNSEVRERDAGDMVIGLASALFAGCELPNTFVDLQVVVTFNMCTLFALIIINLCQVTWPKYYLLCLQHGYVATPNLFEDLWMWIIIHCEYQ